MHIRKLSTSCCFDKSNNREFPQHFGACSDCSFKTFGSACICTRAPVLNSFFINQPLPVGLTALFHTTCDESAKMLDATSRRTAIDPRLPTTQQELLGLHHYWSFQMSSAILTRAHASSLTQMEELSIWSMPQITSNKHRMRSFFFFV